MLVYQDQDARRVDNNTVHCNVLLWLYLYRGENWKIKTYKKETGQILEKM